MSHCQLFYSLSEGTLGTDVLAYSWPRGLRKHAFPPLSLLAQTLCKVREDEEQVLLVASYWPNLTWFPELMLLATEEGSPFSERGHPRPDLWNLHVWSLDGTRPHLVPSWDLPSVLTALEEPFEPLQSVELKFLSLKTVLLTALASVKRVGDLQAFSVDDLCLEFGPSNSHIPQTLAWICAQSSHHAL